MSIDEIADSSDDREDNDGNKRSIEYPCKCNRTTSDDESEDKCEESDSNICQPCEWREEFQEDRKDAEKE